MSHSVLIAPSEYPLARMPALKPSYCGVQGSPLLLAHRPAQQVGLAERVARRPSAAIAMTCSW